MGKKHNSAAAKLNSVQVDAGIRGSDSVTEAFRSSRDIADAMVPSGLRTMLEMQRGIRSLVDPCQKLGLNIQPDAFASITGAKRFGLAPFAHDDFVEGDCSGSLGLPWSGLGRPHGTAHSG